MTANMFCKLALESFWGAKNNFLGNEEGCVLAVIVLILHSTHPVVSLLKLSAN